MVVVPNNHAIFINMQSLATDVEWAFEKTIYLEINDDEVWPQKLFKERVSDVDIILWKDVKDGKGCANSDHTWPPISHAWQKWSLLVEFHFC